MATKKENDRFVTGALIKLSTAARQYTIVNIYAKHITERLERFVRANLGLEIIRQHLKATIFVMV